MLIRRSVIIFVIRSLTLCPKYSFGATSQAIVPGFKRRGRKVRTAQSNAPVNSRAADRKRQWTESATENNYLSNEEKMKT